MLKIKYAYVLYLIHPDHLLNIQQFFLMYQLLIDILLLLNKVMYHDHYYEYHRLIRSVKKKSEISFRKKK
jgi:hypothetical protein